MIGLNNEFCSSKEEYEIARLATKCAGLQGKIDDLTDALERIATPKRSDGTYNLCREACEALARQTLKGVKL